MFKKDIDKVKELHSKYNFQSPVCDAGGLENPTIADYDISKNCAYEVTLELEGQQRNIKIPNNNQNNRYVNINRPFSFIDKNYLVLNPDKGDPYIEQLPEKYTEHFNFVILVSVFEHIENPYVVSDALYKIIKKGGYLFNSTPFIFPYHPSPEDNFRFSPKALRLIHESSGFKWLEGDFHINHSTAEGIGDTNPKNYLAPQAIMASYALCQKI